MEMDSLKFLVGKEFESDLPLMKKPSSDNDHVDTDPAYIDFKK